ncbi:CMP-sialic acid transporter 1-like [Galendromus occidentalis]|uniref:CMP-sialic acid transporter 1-like n=1 Tax=Galendromus occidentalis TaxID=34638 RepID=A0AAJ6QWL8_9ACAR|nr:CMP-sialic acid transporter 1-like [Galendromus occidentalis]
MDDAEPLVVESKISIFGAPSTLNVARQQPLSSRTSVKLCFLIGSSELVKVVGSYGIRYYNGDTFPMDQTFFVVLLELSKALVCFFVHTLTHEGSAWSPFNWRLLLPSVVYAMTNNIFLLSLAYVTPAVWMVLVQARIPLTLFLYKVLFRRIISGSQWIGASLMCIAIGVCQLPELSAGVTRNLAVAFVLALLNSVLSASAAVYTELLFKNPQHSNIWKQQFQMYTGGAVFALVPFIYSSLVFQKELISEAPASIWCLVLLTWFTAAMHGICVALLVKKLDNVVKYQVACVVHLLNSGLNQLLFPDRFTLTPHFAISLIILFYAVHVYENRTFALTKR